MVAGKYRIVRVLGAGAMGTVVLARQLHLDQDVAIKFLVPSALGKVDSLARFLREARAAARIRSEHVVRVFDVDLLDGAVPFIEMEYLRGCDLAAWLGERGPLAVQTAVDFVLQACDAIAEAHGIGIIHRDIKPANLFVVQRPGVVDTVKVVDFGISKARDLVSSTVPPADWPRGAVTTEEQTPIGSPCYMSPEQMESARDVDERTDIWALGVTLFELVTGHLPFEGTSLVQVYSKIRSGERQAVHALVPQAPAALEAVIDRCLRADRRERFGSVRELANALVAFGSARAPGYVLQLPAVAPPSPTPRANPSVLAPHTAVDTLPSAAEPRSVVPRRRPQALAVAGALALLALASAAALMFDGRRGDRSADVHRAQRDDSDPGAAAPSRVPPSNKDAEHASSPGAGLRGSMDPGPAEAAALRATTSPPIPFAPAPVVRLRKRELAPSPDRSARPASRAVAAADAATPADRASMPATTGAVPSKPAWTPPDSPE